VTLEEGADWRSRCVADGRMVSVRSRREVGVGERNGHWPEEFADLLQQLSRSAESVNCCWVCFRTGPSCSLKVQIYRPYQIAGITRYW
jgi:hypothetical protein